MLRLVNTIAALGLIASFAVALITLPGLPERIPVHFDFRGNPDRYGSRWMILLVPLINTGIYAMLTVFARLDRRWYSFPRASSERGRQQQVRLIRILLGMLNMEITWIFTALALEVAVVAHGHEGFGPFLLVAALGIMAITIVGFVLRVLTVR